MPTSSTSPRLAELWRYPVKAMAGERVDHLTLADKLEGDRDWGVFDAGTGKLLSAKTVPQLLEARARGAGDAVMIELPGGEEIAARDADAALGRWLGRAVRLRRAGADQVATIDLELDDGEGAGPRGLDSFTTSAGSLFDSRSTLHLVARASLAALDAAHGPGAGDPRRYRPNLILDGLDAFAEEAWVGASVTIGAATVLVRKRTERCVVPSRAQPGLPADRALLRYLKGERGFCVGIYAGPTTGGEIREGAPVRPG